MESVEIKKQIFKQLEGIVAEDAILATNTSSLSVTEISTGQLAPGPGHRRALLQPGAGAGVRRDRADRGHRARACSRTSPALVQALGKNPVVCGDKAGFIANTLLFGYLNHAVSMYEQRYASREDIDAAMRFGCGYPMGPLALLDLIGLDTAYEILETMYRQGRDRLHAPAPILKQMVTAGMLGRKTGKGFYTYEAADSPVVVDDDKTPSADDKPQLKHDIDARRRRRHRHDGHRHRRGLRQGWVRRRLRRSLAGQGRRGRVRRSSARSTRRSSAASSTSPPRRTCSAGSPAPPRSTTSARSTSRSRRSPRTSRSRPRCSRTSTRSASPARSSRPRRPRCRSSSAPRPPAGRRTSSGCTSSTRRRS